MLDVIPHINPSPPEREAIGGRELIYGDDKDDDSFLFLCQHMTSCLPPASMAQKKPLSPNAAAIGAIDPYPEAGMKNNEKRRENKNGE